MKMKRYKFIAGIMAVVLAVSMISPLPVKAEKSRVETLVENMTLKEKIIQMMMVDFRKWDTNLKDSKGAEDFVKMNDQVRGILETYNFGAVLHYANNIQQTEQAFVLTKEMQNAAIKNGGIPMFIAADQEGGNVYRLGSGTALPGNMALGAARDESYSEKAGEVIGSELAGIGINLNLAPVVDVNNNANNPVIGLRSFGDDAQSVGRLASAYIKGLDQHNVIGCAKHFPGHGDTDTDSHYGLPVVNKKQEILWENELKPYQVAISQGIEMIMTAHILYPQLDQSKLYSEKTKKEESVPATMSYKILTELLKEKMGFDGVIITDSMRMSAIAASWGPVEAVVNAINAGVDMICLPCVLYDLDDLKDLDVIINGVEKAVKDGKIAEERIDDAVARILKLKENRGILDYNADEYTLEKAKAIVGSQKNREMEREIAAAAVTVVKNKQNALPIKLQEDSKVFMLCPNDNERAQMILGWNRAKQAGLVPDGAQMDYYRYSSETLTDTLKKKIDWADTLIVLSEVSSADKMAGRNWMSKGPDNFVNYAKNKGAKTIVISVDKPYDVQLYPNADAVMAVYGCKGSTLDPTEAMNGALTGTDNATGPNITAGIEVALGVFGARGKLPIDIPRFNLSTNTYGNNIYYSRGYGITYDSLIDEEPEEPKPEEPKPEPEEPKPEEPKPEEPKPEPEEPKPEPEEPKPEPEEPKPEEPKPEPEEPKPEPEEPKTEMASPVIEIENVKSTGKIKVIWEKVEGAKEYEVYRASEKNGKYNKIFTTKNLSCLNKSAKAGSTYYYKVRAIGENDEFSEFSTIKKCTCDLARPVIALSNISKTGKVNVSWEKVDGAEVYEVYRAIDKSSTYIKMFTTAKTSYTNTSAVAGRKYYYKVKAIHKTSAANSAYSTAKYRTCDLARPVVTADNSVKGRIRISWEKVSKADIYTIYRSNSANGTYKKVKNVKGNEYTDKSVTKGKTYYYKVKAGVQANSAAVSDYSNRVYKKVR